MITARVDVGQGLTNAFSSVLTFVPKLLLALVIIVIGYIVAKVIAKVLTKLLQRVGFDRLVERGGLKKALDSANTDASTILSKIVFYAIMLFVLSTVSIPRAVCLNEVSKGACMQVCGHTARCNQCNLQLRCAQQ